MVSGYEIHAGISVGAAFENPFAMIGGRNEGVVSDDGQLAGTYMHGVFDEPESREAILLWAGLKDVAASDYFMMQEDAIDRLADEMEASLEIERIVSFLR